MVWRTTAITFTTCFLLGTTFTHWIADHNVLWRTPLTPKALLESMTYYSILGSGPRGLGWVYIAVGMTGVLAIGSRIVGGWKGEEMRGGQVLFDGGSVVLLAGICYNQAVEVYPTMTMIPSPLPGKVVDHPLYPGLATAVRDLANDNVITAVMLTGVLCLQAGRYYSSRASPAPLSLSNTPGAVTPDVMDGDDGPARTTPMRAGTPYRELTEAEAFELRSDEEAEAARDGATGSSDAAQILSATRARKSKTKKR